MEDHNDERRRPTDINSSYVEFTSDEELERAIADATARHPASAHKAPTPDLAETETNQSNSEEEPASTNVVRMPLHRLLDGDKPPTV